MIHKLFKTLAPVAALAGAALVAGCDNVNVSFGDTEGVPLAELDMAGKAPTELVLAGPDKVIVTRGEELDIAISGDERAVEALRFALADDSLAITRAKGEWKDVGQATVRVTMPSLKEIVLAGSGSIEAASMTERAEITIAGSGKVGVADVDADRLDVNVLGSGTLEAAGRADRLDLNVAGSGKSDMSDLKVERADVNLLGSGDASFASDGKVEANIAGSGTVTVIGRATCTINAVGSGKLRCKDGFTRGKNDVRRSLDTPPPAGSTTPPPAPEAPEAPEAPDA